GNALAWWKAYKQAKGGDTWLITVTWAEFKKLLFLQFFPRAEQERNSGNGHDQRNRGQQSNRSVNSGNSFSPGAPLRATPTRFALHVDADTQESVVELLADKKPGASGRVFAITEDHATKTSGFLATIHDTTSDVPSIHDQPFDRIKGVKGSATGIVRARLYSSECVPVGCTNFICQEKEW
nr:zinc finger, CCHC-type, retrotransposon Gag domain protein [Tanacetum cinerariifolium]